VLTGPVRNSGNFIGTIFEQTKSVLVTIVRRPTMIKLLLACGIWCAVFVIALMGLIITDPGNPRFTGTIVHDFKPFCQSFVVQTEHGFVILEWEDGILVFGEGDTLVGPLHTKGLQSIEVEGRGQLTARFETWASSLAEAQQMFRERCRLSPTTPLAGPSIK
jgi:hypothetical protein